ncbi:uncharacterized protein [Argopecten irradians]|uniref:uncharacterized protein n=1 Tax=Argopecten irradians TaxID=31199 RepID=UPI0037140D3C
MEGLYFTPVSFLLITLLVNTVNGHGLDKSREPLSDRALRTKTELAKMQKDSDWSEIFDYNLAHLESHLITESNNMINGLFEESETGSSGNDRALNDMEDLMNQLRNLRGSLNKMSTAHAQLEKRMNAALRERTNNQQNTMNVANMIHDLNTMSSKLAHMSGAISNLSGRAGEIRHKSPEVSRPGNCQEVKNCNSNYGDGEYFIYPGSLGGQKVKVFCSGMSGDEPKEYITLHSTNTGTYNYSLRTDNSPCTFQDRVGDALSDFRKIRVDVEDMSVQRYDFSYANNINEDSDTWQTPKFGSGGGCSWDYMYRDYRNCIAPGGFVIDTSGTGLVVDPELQWMSYGYGGRLDTVYRSKNNAHVTAACDGWCAWCFPIGEMILHLEPAVGLKGDATEPVCG